MAEENKLITVYKGDFPYAGIVKGLLENEGIAASLENELLPSLVPGATGALGVSVTVPQKDFDRAKDIIQKYSTEKKQDETNDKFAVKTLIEELKDKDPSIRYDATQALGKTGAKSAVEPLIEMLKDKDRYTCLSAAGSLKKITGQILEPNYDKWKNWWEKNKDTFQEKE